ncbi:MAG: S-layer homology domain-containing protein [Armatimonadetes bacterium]|nr:S-layer homology domain-containing protein [Armatimonadota bacterium]
MSRLFAVAWMILVLAAPVSAAPLFPDVPDAHWAKDAVAALAARGLVEGYPDGTFKGDRTATRWEVAMVVARLLARMEQEHATFATRAELDELRKLSSALREELDALGVRVRNLEEGVERIDRRVGELERITFYGVFETRIVSQSFSNSGAGDNDGERRGGGLAPPNNVPFLNYHNLVGSAPAGSMRPQVQGIFPVVDFRSGRALTNGVAFTSRLNLGLRLALSENLEGGAEFSAFSAQGDRFVEAYWGVTAPYLSNVFTANAGGPAPGVQPLNDQPFTRVTLDSFWVHHKPSKTRLILGEFTETRMDPIVYAGQPNLGAYGPRRFAGYGFDATGQVDLDGSLLRWEALGTRFGHGVRFLGNSYQNFVLAANLGYEFHEGAGGVKLNFARMAEEAPSGGPLVVGLISGLNVAYGNSAGWTPRQWVNPPGHFAAERSVFEQLNTGAVAGVLAPNTVDTRPIVGWNGMADNAAGFAAAGGGGNYGPQSQDQYGLSARYRWDLGEPGEPSIRLGGFFAHSDYRPTRNSSYSAGGDAASVELGARLLEDDLDLSLEYLTVDPTYAPAGWFANALGLRPVRTMNFSGVFHLHDWLNYPHNREGWRLKGRWNWDEDRGSLWTALTLLEQKETSLYDVRVLPGTVAPGAPNFPVLGFSPGFVDAIFSGYAHPFLYGPGTPSSFTDSLQPLEDRRGSEARYEIGLSYKFLEPKLKVSALYEHGSYKRPSGLAPGLGGSQNLVDMDTDYLNLDLTYTPDEAWTVFGGVDWIRARGHLDPGGLYNGYAIQNQTIDFDNLDTRQLSPYVGFDQKLAANTTWNLTVRRYDTEDEAGPEIRAGTAFDTFGSSQHPFSWDGWQISTQFAVKF